MQNKIKLIIAAVILSSVAVFIVVLYIASAVMHKIPTHIALIIGIVFSITDITIAVIFITKPGTPTQTNSNPNGHAGIPYSDSLISIDDEGITIKLFYFPYGAKRVNFSNVEVVQAFKGGCMRLWGSGDFRTWFGLDWGRMSRKMTFIIKQKNKWGRVGFTCEDSDSVAKILQSKIPIQNLKF
jgi:hypothetical protein